MQINKETLYEACERFKDLLRLCPHHGLQYWMIIQAFYNGVTQSVRPTIDVAAGGALMNKIEDAYNLIEEMALIIFNGPPNKANPNGLEVSLKLMCLFTFFQSGCYDSKTRPNEC